MKRSCARTRLASTTICRERLTDRRVVGVPGLSAESRSNRSCPDPAAVTASLPATGEKSFGQRCPPVGACPPSRNLCPRLSRGYRQGRRLQLGSWLRVRTLPTSISASDCAPHANVAHAWQPAHSQPGRCRGRCIICRKVLPRWESCPQCENVKRIAVRGHGGPGPSQRCYNDLAAG
jgi:hypothetical protein